MSGIDPPPEPEALARIPGEKCFACGSTEFQPLFTATDRLYRTTTEQFRIVECRECHLIRLFPRPAPSDLNRYYPPNYWYVTGASAAARLEELYRRLVVGDHVRFVERAIRESGESGLVLDVGCGGGLFLAMLRKRGARQVVGLDFSIDAARAASDRYGLRVACATLSHAPFAAGGFSAITMFHVLEHLFDPRSYLDAAYKLLRPDGRLIVQTPNVACWQFLLLGENWTGLDVPRHIFNYRDSDLEALLAASGFEVLRRKYFSLRDNPAGLASSLAPWLDPMVRRMRGLREAAFARLLKDLLYFGLVVAALPLTALEAACRAGSTIMLEARKKR